MAQKEMSVKLCEALFKTARVKASEVKDGDEIFTLESGALHLGDAVRCDECPNVSTINSAMIDAAGTSETALFSKLASGVKFVYSNRLLSTDSIGCYDADGSGNVLCPDCAAKRTASA